MKPSIAVTKEEPAAGSVADVTWLETAVESTADAAVREAPEPARVDPAAGPEAGVGEAAEGVTATAL
jgi:hypothetical protein